MDSTSFSVFPVGVGGVGDTPITIQMVQQQQETETHGKKMN
jgi:hypothetical protein